MADLAINPPEVMTDLTQPATEEQGIAGEAISAGDLVYLDSPTTQYLRAFATDMSAVMADVRGMALNTAAAHQPLRIQRTGRVTLGATAAPTVGQLYVLSSAHGKTAPASDLTSGWHATCIGVGYPSNQLELNIYASGQVVP